MTSQDGIPEAREPVAVIGIGCRFPGGADGPENYWRLLRNGVDAVSEMSATRWGADRLREIASDPIKMRTRWAGFLDSVDQFDAAFFRISPREASRMDPQQRLSLEVSWEALENAGLVPERLAASSTGVFLGIASFDYGALQLGSGSDGVDDPYAGTGSALSIAPNRVSYFFDFRGPSLAVDTACSSSLVAVHLACQNLRSGECDLALAGGVNLLLTLSLSAAFNRSGFLASDGRCKAFDARADGYVRGEGCGVVVLKRLSDALADGDRVRAVIRGSAVNQDGRSNGLTAPNRWSQIAVIQTAHRAAGVTPAQVGYVEAHGTGTPLGDPIEAAALGAVMLAGGARETPCALGSVKTNFGHLEAAAGIAGLIKTVLVLEHGEIPPSLHYENPNPHIPFGELNLQVQKSLCAWPGGELPRIAGVSAFGFGGTNAHVVLEEAPPVPRASGQGRAGESLILPLSTRSPEALRELGRRYADRLRSLDEGELEGFCATAALRRSHHLEHRLAVTGETAMELAAQLELAAEQRSAAGLGSVSAAAVVFVFSGQGSQYAGMCGQLLDQEPVFRAAIEACEAALGPHAGELFARYGGLLDQLRSGEAESLERTELAQPLLFAVQFGLTALWRSWGIEPAAVLGHSLGEVAAACAAGALELDDAARIVALRGSLMQPLHGRGTMVALPLDHAEALAAIESCAGEVAIAALNGPRSTVLSGTVRALEALVARLPAGGPGARWLPVAYAFHGPEMAPIAQALEAGLAGLRPRTPTLPLISTVTAARVTGQEQLLGAHWAQGAAAPVRFAAGLASLAAQMPEETIYLEIGPRPVLRGALAACLSQGTAVLSSLDQGRNDRSALLHTAATLYQHRVPIRWNQILPHPLTPAPLPLYPWQQKSFWLKNHILPSDKPSPALADQFSIIEHPAPQPDAPDEWLYEPRWQALTAEDPERALPQPNSAAGGWLIFSDLQGEGEALANHLILRGAHCHIVRHGKGYERDGLGRYVIQPGDAADMHALFQSIADSGSTRLRGIVHLWSLDAEPSDRLTAASLTFAQAIGCASVLQLIQQATSKKRSLSAPLWFITRGSQPAGDRTEMSGIAQSSLWGMGRVFAEEHGEHFGGLIDLDAQAAIGESAQRIAEELLHPSPEKQLALRETLRYAPRLIRVARSARPDDRPTLRPDRSYLITGGLGAIGLRLARWMIDRGARRLVLLGRSAIPPRDEWHALDSHNPMRKAIDAVLELEALGASVHLAPVDVADESQLTLFLDRFRREGWPRIGGVVHAAAVVQESAIAQATSDALMDVLRPKLLGSWLLHQLLREEPLEFFLLFSSAASLLGPPGQACYAAANAFLDGLAHFRRAGKFTALSMNWGMWEDTGLAASRGGMLLRRHLKARGVDPLPPKTALGLLDRLIAHDTPEVAVLQVDWLRFRDSQEPGNRSMTAALADGQTQDGRKRSTQGHHEEVPRSLREFEQIVREQVAGVLCLESSQIASNRPFEELGMDSMTGLELRNRLEAALPLSLPATTAWNYSTISLLAAYLAKRLRLAGYDIAGYDIQEERRATEGTDQETVDDEFEQTARELIRLASAFSESDIPDLLAQERLTAEFGQHSVSPGQD